MYSHTSDPMSFSPNQIRRALKPLRIAVTASQAEQFAEYAEILVQWNQKVNLTAMTAPREILARHFGESLFAASVVPIQKGRLADVGSGAGFPGLALKVVCPELQVTLIEPNGKKAAFLAEVKRRLGLAEVEIVRERIEHLPATEPGFDFVTARAVGGFTGLLGWTEGALSRAGAVVLWLGAQEASRLSQVAGWIWRRPIPIPQSRERVLLVGSPEIR